MRRHRGWKAAANTIASVCLAIIFVVLSPVIIFLVLPLVMAAHRRRLQAAARAFECLSCGGILGPESLRLADAAWREHFRKLLEKHHRIRLLRYLHAICPACSARYTFVEHDRTFVPAPADRAL
jgi:uncharacterized membrane protein YbhN (UPF0104 family)